MQRSKTIFFSYVHMRGISLNKVIYSTDKRKIIVNLIALGGRGGGGGGGGGSQEFWHNPNIAYSFGKIDDKQCAKCAQTMPFLSTVNLAPSKRKAVCTCVFFPGFFSAHAGPWLGMEYTILLKVAMTPYHKSGRVYITTVSLFLVLV